MEEEEQWVQFFSSVSMFLQTICERYHNFDLNYHQACLTSNTLELAIMVTRDLELFSVQGNTSNDHLNELNQLLNEIQSIWHERTLDISRRSTTVVDLGPRIHVRHGVGRPSLQVPEEMLECLRSIGMNWSQIAKMLRVSRWTVYRRAREYNLQGSSNWSDISDDNLDSILRMYITRHGCLTGESIVNSDGLQ